MAQTISYRQACNNARRTSQFLRNLPFDAAREAYAKAIRVGLIKDSMLAEAKFAQSLGAMEKLTVGPWARSV